MRFFLILFAMTSQLLFAQTSDHFSTRLNKRLLISGMKCQGSEVTMKFEADGSLNDYFCQPDEWLVVVDNVNRCKDGLCTGEYVDPVTVKLEKARFVSSHIYDFYNLKPTMPVSSAVRWILRRHWVRFSPSGASLVVKKGLFQGD